MRALARAQWSFYNWGFSKKLYYPNQLASSSSSSSFFKSSDYFKGLYSVCFGASLFPGASGHSDGVALLGAPGSNSNPPPEQSPRNVAGLVLQGALPDRCLAVSHSAQGWAENPFSSSVPG